MEETRIHQSPIRVKASAIVLAVCIALMIITAAVGHMIQTSWGTVSTHIYDKYPEETHDEDTEDQKDCQCSVCRAKEGI